MRVAVLAALLLAQRSAAVTPPWARTEVRAACSNATPLRQPFFGDLHIHTHYSADAYIFGTRVGPRDAYDFVRGTTIPVSDEQEQQTRTAQIDRPLDFAAVTDHAELFGEVDVCSLPGSSIFDAQVCQLLRAVEATDAEQFQTTVLWLYLLGIPNPQPALPICSTPGIDCDAAAVSVWQEMQAAAEEAYDRTEACRFTSFIGYEHTPSPLGRHRHRNVIFRNHHVPAIALSHLDTVAGGVPQGLWTAIEQQCVDAGTGCDAVIIPHNSNLSGGEQFVDPPDGADALRRQRREPLVEIHQIKGNSECRFDRLAGAGVGTPDELCTFEQMLTAHEGPDATVLPIADYPRRNLVRETLVDGLSFEETLGANPFRMGFVGGTDTHNGNGGDTEERAWVGGQGRNDGSAAAQIRDTLRTNPGGLTVAWAEENSRDALFSAFARRETYATSGTRPIVRFFAGALTGVVCGAPDFVERAYATGTPMGGELGRPSGAAVPRFAAWAMKDPGTVAIPGVGLQRIQIVKAWIDGAGAKQEQVVDVAGDTSGGAGVNPITCEPTGPGAGELCAIWEDPAFDPDERALYYARVLEQPSCRWSTTVCQQAGVDPFAADCATQPAGAAPAFADCCLANTNDPFLSPTIQERAWTSPVWYRPESIGRLRARLAFGRGSGRDGLVLQAALARRPLGWDPVRDGLTLRLHDDDEIVAVTIPPGGLRRRGRRLVFKSHATAKLVLSVVPRRAGLILSLAMRAADLSRADRESHAIRLTLASGAFQTEQSRQWVQRGRHLGPP